MFSRQAELERTYSEPSLEDWCRGGDEVSGQLIRVVDFVVWLSDRVGERCGLLNGVVVFGVLRQYRGGGCVWTIKSEVRRYGLLECRNI